MSRERYHVRSDSEPAGGGGPPFFVVQVVDTSVVLELSGGREAYGEYLLLTPDGRRVRVEFGRARFSASSSARPAWYQEDTLARAVATLAASPDRPPVLTVSARRSDPAFARALPAALEGAAERFAHSPRAQQDLGAYATELLLAWLERRPWP